MENGSSEGSLNRKEFLKLIVLGTTAVAATTCLGACLSGCSESTTGPTNVDFTLDLTASENTALNTVGGYIQRNGVIVARTGSSEFTAVQLACTHEGVSIVWQQSANRFYCAEHGSSFSRTGAVTGGPAPRSLSTYNTTLSGTSLRVYS